MTENLKPCPFCGGEARLVALETIGNGVTYFVKCAGNKSKCAGPIHTKYCDTEERAAETWNHRAERTCHNVTGTDCMFKCSECGAEFELLTVNGNEYGEVFYEPFKPKYCSVCGAEVVE